MSAMATRLIAVVATYVTLGVAPDVRAQDRAQDQPVPPMVETSETNRSVKGDSTWLFPGSLLINGGYASPLEEQNFVTVYALEQGVVVLGRERHRIVSFVTMTGGFDRRGFDWNNRVGVQAGVKYVRNYPTGVVQLGGGYVHESRLRSAVRQGQPLWFANYWFGWAGRAPAKGSRAILTSLPGSSWASVGTQAPTEPKNIITTIFIEQGVTLFRVSRLAAVPYVEYTLGVDSSRHFWNNRQVFGEGLKLRVAVGRGVIETVGVYKHERRWLTRQSRAQATASINFWYGWAPSKQQTNEGRPAATPIGSP